MTSMRSRFRSITNKDAWTARGGSFLVKAKATKAIWFPPQGAETVEKASSTAKKAASSSKKSVSGSTKKAAKKTTGAAKKASGASKTAKRAAKKTSTDKAT
jgi:hypothetical protein